MTREWEVEYVLSTIASTSGCYYMPWVKNYMLFYANKSNQTNQIEIYTKITLVKRISKMFIKDKKYRICIISITMLLRKVTLII